MTRKQRQKIIVDAYADWSYFGIPTIFVGTFLIIGLLTLLGFKYERLDMIEYSIVAFLSTVMVYFEELTIVKKEAFFNALEDFEKNGKLTKLENAMLPSEEAKTEKKE